MQATLAPNSPPVPAAIVIFMMDEVASKLQSSIDLMIIGPVSGAGADSLRSGKTVNIHNYKIPDSRNINHKIHELTSAPNPN
jgi:hypothetical protein